MKFLSIIFILLICKINAQDLLRFINDEPLKNEIQKSILFIELSDKIPQKIKDKIIFITYDNDEGFMIPEIEYFGFSYSTYIPLQWAVLDHNGQFKSQIEKFKFFNFSKNIVLVFRDMDNYLDLNKMQIISNQTKISTSQLSNAEYFDFSKSDGFFEDSVDNTHSFERKNNTYKVSDINCPIDLDTFLKIWFDLNIGYFKLNPN